MWDGEGDLDREIREHLELEAEERQAAGLSAEDARLAARRAFGNTTYIKEEVRQMWGWNSFDALRQDIHYGFRQLRRYPGFTAVAVLTLALGIGANTAIFSAVYSVLLRPLPFRQPARLVQLFETEVAPGNYPLSGPDYLEWQAQARTLQAASLLSYPRTMSAGGAREPEAAAVISTQANFFNVLGVQPIAGRAFAAGEDVAGKDRIAILSHGFAQRRFGGAANAIGRALTLNGESYVVIGVMPPWFNFPAATDAWTPLDMRPSTLGPRGTHQWRAIARLKPGAALEEARADLLAISERLEKQFPNSNNRVHAVLIPLREELVGNSQRALLILLGAVALLLFVACANVANLLLARATTRHREMALRASLGASRLRLVRQLVTESLLLALGGAALGAAGAWWCVRAVQAAKAVPIPRVNPIELDPHVLAFTIGLSVLTGILFGLAPALQASKSNPGEELKAAAQPVVGAGGRGTLRDALVIAEIAITLALLVGAGLLLRSFARLRSTDLGIDTRNVLTMTLNLPRVKYRTLETRREFFNRLTDRVAHTPGVETAAISTEIPLEGGSNGYIRVDGADPALTRQLVGWNYITPDYFRTLRIPLLEGRSFTDADFDRAAERGREIQELIRAAKGTRVTFPPDFTLDAVISRTMAQTFWPNEDPAGRSFRWNDVPVHVIGVVADVKEYGIRHAPMPQAYYPFTLMLADGGFGRLTVKTRVPPLAVLSAIRGHVRALDPGLAVIRARTMDDVIAGNVQETTFQAFLLSSFAVLALALATVGLYGVMSYLVTQRTREIGIRMAIGAHQADVLRLIMKHGVTLTFAGVALGLVAAMALTRLIGTLLYGVSPADPLTFASVAALLLMVSLAAYYIPARRAARIDPMAALRYE